MSLSTGTRLGPYEILALIGAGGMGEVYRARDTRLDRVVAIKVCAAQFSERFDREARAIAALNHQHICALYDVGPDFLVMELVEGPTLADRIAAGPVPLEEALGIARQIAEALEAAHEKGIVHRDLKPANVKLTADGNVEVLDFGLAKALEVENAAVDPRSSPTITISPTRPGMILGTAAYMSPEQARGMVVDKRADIWAFGVLLFEMLTARAAFAGETISDTLASVLKTDPDWSALPADTPAPIRRVLRRCLQRDRKRRLRDIGDVLVELDESQLDRDVPAKGVAGTTARTPWRWLWIAIAAAALFFATTSVLLVWQFRQNVPPRDTVRFVISPPGKAGFIRGSWGVSPDGRHVAFTAPGSDGRNILWIRDMDSVEPRAIEGTENAAYPFWSSDSRFIAFGCAGKLKKVRVSGGTPQTLCNAPDPVLGGSWNSEGVIIFGGPTGSVIRRVSEAGGIADAITQLDASRKEGFHAYPTFLQDGQHFVFLRVMAAPSTGTGAYLGSLNARPDSQPSRLLVETRLGPAYIRSSDPRWGYLLFIRDGTLLVQRFDTKRLELTDRPAPLVDHVFTYRTSGLFSASEKVLTYRVGRAESRLGWFDREGKPMGEIGEPAIYRSVSLSANGKRAAVARLDEAASGFKIWLLEFARGGAGFQLTFGPGSFMDGPVWSPNGDTIIFASSREGRPNVFQKLANGVGEEKPLLPPGSARFPNDWSRDGHWLLYSEVDLKTRSDLWVLQDPNGRAGDRKPIPFAATDADEGQGQFSPDGHWIVYTSDESGKQEIYVRPFPPSAGAGKWLISKGGGAQPRWRKSTEIIYLSADHKLTAVEVTTSPTFKSGPPKPLFTAPIYFSATDLQRYDVTADGNRLLINRDPLETESSPMMVVSNWTATLDNR
jgi:predicted Ser/Thr protein kinase